MVVLHPRSEQNFSTYIGLTKVILEQEPKAGPGAEEDPLQLIKNDVKEKLKGRREKSC